MGTKQVRIIGSKIYSSMITLNMLPSWGIWALLKLVCSNLTLATKKNERDLITRCKNFEVQGWIKQLWCVHAKVSVCTWDGGFYAIFIHLIHSEVLLSVTVRFSKGFFLSVPLSSRNTMENLSCAKQATFGLKPH